eukprot:1156871-Pelagomonas_calceolata.AAC.2
MQAFRYARSTRTLVAIEAAAACHSTHLYSRTSKLDSPVSSQLEARMDGWVFGSMMVKCIL